MAKQVRLQINGKTYIAKEIEFLVSPTRVVSENGGLKEVEFIRNKLGEPDESGRRRTVPVEGTEFRVELDTLLPAISQDPEIPEKFGVNLTKWKTIAVDNETFMTSREGVFACGGAVTGPADVTTAMAQARIVADNIHQFLKMQTIKREYHPVRPSVIVEPIKVEEEADLKRVEMPKLSQNVRRDNFKEVELGFDEDTAVKEAKRCMRCDWELTKPLIPKEKEG